MVESISIGSSSDEKDLSNLFIYISFQKVGLSAIFRSTVVYHFCKTSIGKTAGIHVNVSNIQKSLVVTK